MKQDVPAPVSIPGPAAGSIVAGSITDPTQQILTTLDKLALLNLEYCEKAVAQMKDGTPEQVVQALQAHETLKKAMYMTLALRKRIKAGAARKRRKAAAARA